MTSRVNSEPMLSFKSTSKRVKVAAGLILTVVLTSSFILSYNGLQRIAEMSGFSTAVSYIFPLSIDGMLLLGSVFYMSAKESTLARVITVFGVLASIGGNIVSALDAGWLSVVHSLPPITLLLSLALFEQLVRTRTQEEQKAAEQAARKEALELRKAEREMMKEARPVATHLSTREGTTSSTTTGQVQQAQPILRAVASPKPAQGKSKTALVEDYLMKHPDAAPAEVAEALGEERKAISTLVYRVRKRLNAAAA